MNLCSLSLRTHRWEGLPFPSLVSEVGNSRRLGSLSSSRKILRRTCRPEIPPTATKHLRILQYQEPSKGVRLRSLLSKAVVAFHVLGGIIPAHHSPDS